MADGVLGLLLVALRVDLSSMTYEVMDDGCIADDHFREESICMWYKIMG